LGEKGLGGGSIIVGMKTSLYNQIILKISEIEKIINEGKGYNPYRDAKGRFANGPSSAFGDYYVGGSMGSYDRLDRAGLKGIASRTGIATSPLDSKNTEALARTSLCAKVSEEKIESLKDRLYTPKNKAKVMRDLQRIQAVNDNIADIADRIGKVSMMTNIGLTQTDVVNSMRNISQKAKTLKKEASTIFEGSKSYSNEAPEVAKLAEFHAAAAATIDSVISTHTKDGSMFRFDYTKWK